MSNYPQFFEGLDFHGETCKKSASPASILREWRTHISPWAFCKEKFTKAWPDPLRLSIHLTWVTWSPTCEDHASGFQSTRTGAHFLQLGDMKKTWCELGPSCMNLLRYIVCSVPWGGMSLHKSRLHPYRCTESCWIWPSHILPGHRTRFSCRWWWLGN